VITCKVLKAFRHYVPGQTLNLFDGVAELWIRRNLVQRVAMPLAERATVQAPEAAVSRKQSKRTKCT
jgi:hypothetical protein